MPSTDEMRIRHLLGRAGFGATPAEVLAASGKGYEVVVDSLLAANADQDRLELKLDDKKRAPIAPLQAWWVHRMVTSVNPLLERMILFWHNHFTSAISKVGYSQLMQQQYELFRKHALGNIGELAKAVARDPAMLIWLDGRANVKRAPNENFARELMELFLIGIGNYTETDVREAARAFTGWRLDSNLKAFYAPALHDTGMKTVLGKTGNFNGDQIIDLLLEKPQTAQFLAAKFLANFVVPTPAQEMIVKFGKALQGFQYEVKPFLRYLFTSDEFLAESAYRALVKSPADFVVGVRRSIPSTVSDSDSVNAMKLMAQTLFDPPNVAGWPGGPLWLNASTMLARFNFAERVVQQCEVDKLFSDKSVIDRALELAGIPDAGSSTRQALAGYSDVPTNGKSRLQHLREVLHLTLVAPEAQMK